MTPAPVHNENRPCRFCSRPGAVLKHISVIGWTVMCGACALDVLGPDYFKEVLSELL